MSQPAGGARRQRRGGAAETPKDGGVSGRLALTVVGNLVDA
jgi:hypothetical protein